MGSVNSAGVYVYDAADNVSPIHTFANLQATALTAALAPLQKGYVHIASNATDRNTQASAYASSISNPFLCWRADATAGRRYEYTYNGSTWYYLQTSEDIGPSTSGWVDLSSYLLSPFTGGLEGQILSNGTAELRFTLTGSLPSTSSVTEAWSALPAVWRPTTRNRWGTIYAAGYSGGVVLRVAGTGALANRWGVAMTNPQGSIVYTLG